VRAFRLTVANVPLLQRPFGLNTTLPAYRLRGSHLHKHGNTYSLITGSHSLPLRILPNNDGRRLPAVASRVYQFWWFLPLGALLTF